MRSDQMPYPWPPEEEPEGVRLARARDAYFNDGLTRAQLQGEVSGQCLRNRLEVAFIAGWDAAKRDPTP